MKDALGSVQSILVLGGNSDIGVAIAAELGRPRHARVVLAGRDDAALADRRAAAEADGLHVVATEQFDAIKHHLHGEQLQKMFEAHGGFDVVVVAFGVLGDQEEAEREPERAVAMAEVNFVGALSASQEAGNRLAEQGHGSLVVLSSVAGERPRRSNYAYGATKAGIDAFAVGLHEALRPAGVHVLVVRPGFVKTKMTADLEPVPLSTTPQEVARVVARGLQRGARIVWAPPPLRFVMMVLRHLPNAVFRRLPV